MTDNQKGKISVDKEERKNDDYTNGCKSGITNKIKQFLASKHVVQISNTVKNAE